MCHYAVWGNPIAQSKSPRIHQLFAEQFDLPLVYEAKLGDSQKFEMQLRDFFAQGALGANITAPFKERAFALADTHSERCLQAEACNTLKRLENGTLYADNTDGVGLTADLARLGWLESGQNVLVLGAGGATKGVLYPLLQAQQKITLYNRTTQKAAALAQRFAKFGQIQTACWEELQTHKFDLIINATSLGLQGQYVPLPASLLVHAKLYDMQYAREMETPFLQYVRSQGAQSYQDGLGMLVGQAACAFELWWDQSPDVISVLEKLKAEMA